MDSKVFYVCPSKSAYLDGFDLGNPRTLEGNLYSRYGAGLILALKLMDRRLFPTPLAEVGTWRGKGVILCDNNVVVKPSWLPHSKKLLKIRGSRPLDMPIFDLLSIVYGNEGNALAMQLGGPYGWKRYYGQIYLEDLRGFQKAQKRTLQGGPEVFLCNIQTKEYLDPGEGSRGIFDWPRWMLEAMGLLLLESGDRIIQGRWMGEALSVQTQVNRFRDITALVKPILLQGFL